MVIDFALFEDCYFEERIIVSLSFCYFSVWTSRSHDVQHVANMSLFLCVYRIVNKNPIPAHWSNHCIQVCNKTWRAS